MLCCTGKPSREGSEKRKGAFRPLYPSGEKYRNLKSEGRYNPGPRSLRKLCNPREDWFNKRKLPQIKRSVADDSGDGGYILSPEREYVRHTRVNLRPENEYQKKRPKMFESLDPKTDYRKTFEPRKGLCKNRTQNEPPAKSAVL